MEGCEGLVRLCGVREIAAGVLSLSVSKSAGLWSRVAGDALDLALLGTAFATSNRRGRVAGATVAILGITVLDARAAQAVTARHARGPRQARDYSDRSGFPAGTPECAPGLREAHAAR